MLVTDADVPGPVVHPLKILRYPIVTFQDIEAPVRPDTALMECVLRSSRVLVTRDTGIPSQAYLARYPERGLTIVLLRWKESSYSDFQEMAEMILRDGAKWESIAERTPSVISVNRKGSRVKTWESIAETRDLHR